MPEKNQRFAWLDIAKAVTMFLVVFGHALRGGPAQRIVYSFHVAAFFFLSGMTCKTDNLKKRIKNDILRLLVPYYCFSLISIFIFWFLGDFAAGRFQLDVNTSPSHNLAGMLYACPTVFSMKYNLPLWFLPCLFATKMLYYGLSKLFRGAPLPILLGSLSLAVLSAIYTRCIGAGLPFNLSVAPKMLLFFAAGPMVFSRLSAVKSGHRATLLGALLLCTTGAIALLSPGVDYASDYFPNYITFFATASVGSLGICLLCIGFGSSRTLEYVGKSTLSILTMHKFPLLLFQTVGPQKAILARNETAAGILLAAAISLIAIVLCLVADWIIRCYFPFMLGDFSAFGRKRRPPDGS